MTSLIITLLIAGIIAGLIQYFVDFKGLTLYEAPKSNAFNGDEKPSNWTVFYDWVKNHWQFFGYLTIGIAGAFLTPLINEMISGGLSGLLEFKEYAKCIFIQKEGKPICVEPDNWYYLILFGYGIIFGYSSVRIIRSVGSLIIGNISLRQEEQKKKLDEAQKQIDDLKVKLTTLTAQLPKPATLEFATQFENTNQLAIKQSEHNFFDDNEASIEVNKISSLEACEVNPNPTPWKEWRAAESLKLLLKQVNALAPSRNKDSDGMIGDEAHQSRDSDHNPWVWDKVAKRGVVTALDITNDPNAKCDCQILANSLQANKDQRIKYVIWNKQIMNSAAINGAAAWTWRPYSGSNPHNKHIHISVKCEKENYDSTSNWNINII